MFHEAEEPFGACISYFPSKSGMKSSDVLSKSQMMSKSFVSTATQETNEKTSQIIARKLPQMGYYSHFATEEDAHFLTKMALEYYDTDKTGKINPRACLKDIYKILGRSQAPTEKESEDFERHLSKSFNGTIGPDGFRSSAMKYLKAGHYMM